MFQIASILVLAGGLGAAAALGLIYGRRRREARREETVSARGYYTVYERLVHLAVTVSFLVLAGTGFWASVLGEPLRGWLLLTHVAFGGVFAVALALTAVRWAEECRFAVPQEERPTGGDHAGPPPMPRFDGWQQAYFWLSLLAGLVVVLSMTLSLVAWFSSDALDVLKEIHRWAGLVLLAATAAHACRQTLARPGNWLVMVRGRPREQKPQPHGENSA